MYPSISVYVLLCCFFLCLCNMYLSSILLYTTVCLCVFALLLSFRVLHVLVLHSLRSTKKMIPFVCTEYTRKFQTWNMLHFPKSKVKNQPTTTTKKKLKNSFHFLSYVTLVKEDRLNCDGYVVHCTQVYNSIFISWNDELKQRRSKKTID